jgi:signal transduction histidine kinase
MDTEETTVYTAVLISCIVITVIIFYFAISIYRQQRKKLELAKENFVIEVTTTEKERARIANDLHDDLGPLLSVIKFQIDNVSGINATDQFQLQEASKSIDNLINRMREISNDLVPASLLRTGLFISIEEFVRSIEMISKIKIHYSYPSSMTVPHNIGIHSFRIVKELIHNGIKHSKASEILLQCRQIEEGLSIYYLDDGIGLYYEKMIEFSSGFGLKNLRSRVEVMGGTMKTESKTDKGTAFLFKIPLK